MSVIVSKSFSFIISHRQDLLIIQYAFGCFHKAVIPLANRRCSNSFAVVRITTIFNTYNFIMCCIIQERFFIVISSTEMVQSMLELLAHFTWRATASIQVAKLKGQNILEDLLLWQIIKQHSI